MLIHAANGLASSTAHLPEHAIAIHLCDAGEWVMVRAALTDPAEL